MNFTWIWSQSVHRFGRMKAPNLQASIGRRSRTGTRTAAVDALKFGKR
jgi:hypothetical protein